MEISSSRGSVLERPCGAGNMLHQYDKQSAWCMSWRQESCLSLGIWRRPGKSP